MITHALSKYQPETLLVSSGSPANAQCFYLLYLVIYTTGMRFFRQLSEFRLKGDWEKDSFCHVHAVFEAQL